MAERVIRVVMAGDDDDAIFGPGKLGDDVVDGQLAFGCVGGEGVVLYLVALEMGEQVVLDLLVICAANRPRTEGYDLFHILHGTGGIECRRRAAVGRKSRLGRLRRSYRNWRLRLGLIGILVMVAGNDGGRKGEQQDWEREYLHQFIDLGGSAQLSSRTFVIPSEARDPGSSLRYRCCLRRQTPRSLALLRMTTQFELSIFQFAFFSSRARRCLGWTSQAIPILTTYRPTMGAAKMHILITSGLGVTMAAMMKIIRMA